MWKKSLASPDWMQSLCQAQVCHGTEDYATEDWISTNILSRRWQKCPRSKHHQPKMSTYRSWRPTKDTNTRCDLLDFVQSKWSPHSKCSIANLIPRGCLKLMSSITNTQQSWRCILKGHEMTWRPKMASLGTLMDHLERIKAFHKCFVVPILCICHYMSMIFLPKKSLIHQKTPSVSQSDRLTESRCFYTYPGWPLILPSSPRIAIQVLQASRVP